MPEESAGIERIECELEGRDGIFCGRADEIGAWDPAGGATIELVDEAPAGLSRAGSDADTLVVPQLVDDGVKIARPGVDGEDAAGAGGGGADGGRGCQSKKQKGGEYRSKQHLRLRFWYQQCTVYIRTAPCSPTAGLAPVTAAVSMTAVAISLLGESQISA